MSDLPLPKADRGTEELRSRHKIRSVPTEDAGIDATLILDECLLDTLKFAGQLDGPKQEDVQRRYDAGIWLRRLFGRAGLRRRVGMSFEPRSPSEPAMSDARAWNFRCWKETMQDMGRYRFVLQRVCCFDEMPGSYSLLDLVHGLDKLADLRGL